MTELTQQDIVSSNLALLPSYWNESPNAKGLLKAFLQAFDNPHNLMFEILNGTSLQDAVGVQLDVIGKLWGVKRSGSNDTDYRAAILNAISLMTVDSTPERILEVMKFASSSTKLELIEYWPDIHLYMNIPYLNSLIALADSIRAAGVDLRLLFNSEWDNSTLDGGSLDYSTYREGLYVQSDFTQTDATLPIVFGTPSFISGLELTWDTSTGLLNDNYVYTQVRKLNDLISGSTVKYTDFWYLELSFFVKKDATATANMAVMYRFYGAMGERRITLELDPATGNYLATNDDITFTTHLDDTVIIDAGNYYFVYLKIRNTDTVNENSDCRFYPAYSTTLGTYDNTLKGAATIVNLLMDIKANADYQEGAPEYFKCSEIINDEYLVVDGVGDYIVDQNTDNILANSGTEVTDVITRASTLSEHAKLEFGNYLTEVFT